MTTITVWLLISISAAPYNRGNVDVIAKFATEEDCTELQDEIRKLAGSSAALNCLKANVLTNEVENE